LPFWSKRAFLTLEGGIGQRCPMAAIVVRLAVFDGRLALPLDCASPILGFTDNLRTLGQAA
jgi:hypothetical protein